MLAGGQLTTFGFGISNTGVIIGWGAASSAVLAEAVPLGHEVYMAGGKLSEHHAPHSHSTGTGDAHDDERMEAHQEQEQRVLTSWQKPLLATACISVFPTLILPLIPLSTSQDGKVTVNQVSAPNVMLARPVHEIDQRPLVDVQDPPPRLAL